MFSRALQNTSISAPFTGFWSHLFNGQETDDEIANIDGANTTAMFWEYDSRLGRRWNIDLDGKSLIGAYTCFSDNPIINIDPKGNTDYYNLRGKNIGSDGVDNGLVLIALEKSTARDIKKQVRTSGIATLNSIQLQTCTPLPTEEIVKKMDATITTARTGASEYGFVVGHNPSTGDQVSSDVMAGTAGTSSTPPDFKAAEASKAVAKKGAIPEYQIHSHPNVIRYNSAKMNFSIADQGVSGKDISSSVGKYADIVLQDRPPDYMTITETDKNNAKDNPGIWILRTDPVVTVIRFNNSQGEIKSLLFSKYKNVVTKINKDISKKP